MVSFRDSEKAMILNLKSTIMLRTGWTYVTTPSLIIEPASETLVAVTDLYEANLNPDSKPNKLAQLIKSPIVVWVCLLSWVQLHS